MVACSRKSDDPVAKLIFDRYGMNLLQVPAAQLEVGEIVIVKSDGLTWRCAYDAVFEDQLPQNIRSVEAEDLPDLQETISRKLDVSAGLTFIERLYVGASGAKAKIGAKHKGADKLRLKLSGVSRDMVDLGMVDGALRSARVSPDQGLFREGDAILMVQAVYRARGLDVVALASDGTHMDVEVSAEDLAEVSGTVSVERLAQGTNSWKSKQPKAFGVTLVGVVCDGGGWRLDTVNRVYQIRGVQELESSDRRFLNGANSEALFTALEEPPCGRLDA